MEDELKTANELEERLSEIIKTLNNDEVEYPMGLVMEGNILKAITPYVKRFEKLQKGNAKRIESENFCPHCSCLIIEEDAKWGRCPKCYNEYGE